MPALTGRTRIGVFFAAARWSAQPCERGNPANAARPAGSVPEDLPAGIISYVRADIGAYPLRKDILSRQLGRAGLRLLRAAHLTGQTGSHGRIGRDGGVMAGEQDWVPPGVDIKRANTARVYDYWLGGSHNFLADQDVARSIAAIEPNAPAGARANRAFLGRAVRFLAAAGISQYLDIGSGIPTEGNVHHIAQQASPGSRVVYADIDPVAIAHSKAILAGDENTAAINADLRDPEKVLAHPTTRRLIEAGRPTGLLLSMVLHFIADADDPWRIVATLRDALAPGSYFVLCHATNESKPVVAQAAETVYNRSVSTQIHMRSRADILRFFDGFELLDPGLVYIPQWRPDSPADVPRDPSKFWVLVGVAHKP
jgi:hypothetical protein